MTYLQGSCSIHGHVWDLQQRHEVSGIVTVIAGTGRRVGARSWAGHDSTTRSIADKLLPLTTKQARSSVPIIHNASINTASKKEINNYERTPPAISIISFKKNFEMLSVRSLITFIGGHENLGVEILGLRQVTQAITANRNEFNTWQP